MGIWLELDLPVGTATCIGNLVQTMFELDQHAFVALLSSKRCGHN